MIKYQGLALETQFYQKHLLNRSGLNRIFFWTRVGPKMTDSGWDCWSGNPDLLHYSCLRFVFLLGDKEDIWKSASVNMNDVKPFRVVIEAKRGVGYKGDISIDDISFTSDCKVDFKATLNPNPITPSPPPGCKSGQYRLVEV